jgi:hypothetical protein
MLNEFGHYISRLYFKLPANDFFPITCLRITLRVNLEFSSSWERSIFFFQKKVENNFQK